MGATQTASFPSSWKYDVFLSFCGVDTLKNFTDHLYTALEQKCIVTFKDDEKLERGKHISLELLKAIEESKYAIIVLSKNYPFSKWCLIELAKIVVCMIETGLIVLPIFYHVDPSHVRNQTGPLVEAFAKHERDAKVNKEDVQAWRDALKEVGNISGWHLFDRHESIIIQQICKRIFSELNRKFSSTISKDLVGIEFRVREMLDSYLGEGLGGVRFVGICGMGGMGKTTLAQEIYKRISSNFEACSFIANVREETKNQGLVSLQKQLLSKILMECEINIWDFHEGVNLIGNTICYKKVFIVLDDVDGEEQLRALAGKHDWFGPRSRIIVTSRDSHLLIRCGVNDIYTAKGLNQDDALQLFSWQAFNKPHPEEKYVDLTKHFVNYAKGLPLTLKVLGSLLFTKRIDEWKSALDKIKEEPNRNILDILQISFDGLTDTQKGLFLDIACFFKGENKDCIRDILESFGYYPDYNIGVLMDKSLITIDDQGTLGMHDLLQDMGREIVRHESPKEPSGRSRLWIYEDVLHVLKNNTGTEAIEDIMLNIPIQKVEHLSAKAFSKIKNLRLLKIGNAQLPKSFTKSTMQLPKEPIRGKVQLPQGLRYLSNELRVIEWHGYHLKCIPTNFQPNKLVELRMHSSGIKRLWKGIMILDELKLIDLSDSHNLIETPDFSGVPNLKQLILQHCTRLSKIHASLGNLKRLVRLDLNCCKCLESLPHKINLQSLEIFILSGCSRIKKFPDFVENMSSMLELYLNETAIKDLPLSVKHLTSLIKLDLSDCKNLSSLPHACYNLMSLKVLSISGCSKLDVLLENLGNLEGLEELDVSRTTIKGLPTSINLLKNLRVLSLRGYEGRSPISLNKLSIFPLIQQNRSLDPMAMLEHSLLGLCSLTKLDLSYCNLQAIPDVFGCLSSLLKLYLEGNNFVCLPKSMIQLSNLQDLFLSCCTSLHSLPKLPLNISYIDATECTSLETLSLRPEYDFRPTFRLFNCVKLIENQGYGDILLTMLRRYYINDQHYCGQYKLTHCIEVPGGEIPKCFRHQNVGASVSLQMPSDFCNKLVGIAVCVVYVFRQHIPFDQLDFQHWAHHRFTHNLSWSIELNEYKINEQINGFSEEFGKIEPHHLWLEYYPSEFFEKDWKEALSKSNANGFSDMEIKFKTRGPGLEVMKCGAHLVFKQDIEDLRRTMVGSESSGSITSYEHDFDNSARDIIIKGSRDDCDGEGAGPSGKCTSNNNDVDAPHPKWIHHPNLIENWIGNFCTQ